MEQGNRQGRGFWEPATDVRRFKCTAGKTGKPPEEGGGRLTDGGGGVRRDGIYMEKIGWHTG